jgi:hypothetical protein
MELQKFEKILTLNDYHYDVLLECTFLLFKHMKEKNSKDKCNTEFLSLRLKDSEKNPFAKDLVLEWAVLPKPPRNDGMD